jgi:hypothetical protein
MSAVTGDLLKFYRDLGISRCNIGLDAGTWELPDRVMPLIEQCSKLIPAL